MIVHFMKSLKSKFRTKEVFRLIQKGNDMIMTKKNIKRILEKQLAVIFVKNR